MIGPQFLIQDQRFVSSTRKTDFANFVFNSLGRPGNLVLKISAILVKYPSFEGFFKCFD